MDFLTIKPFVARTEDGDYFFFSKRQAQAFALARNGFFDTTESLLKIAQLKGVMPF